MKDERKTVLFDLDGTLTDPKVGITSAIRYALAKLKRPLSPTTNLDWCIGPPIQHYFATLLATDDPILIDQGIVAYREYYAEIGLLENDLYTGVPMMLSALVDLGVRCYVATSKPAVYARQIVAHFGLSDYFVRVYGSELTGVNGHKGDLIRHILAEEKLRPAQTIMIGDRSFDMVGARENGVLAVGVLYGYGSRAELEESGAHFVVQNPAEIVNLYQKMGVV